MDARETCSINRVNEFTHIKQEFDQCTTVKKRKKEKDTNRPKNVIKTRLRRQ